MTKKELSQLYYLKQEIKLQQMQLAELETKATNCSSTITGLPSNGLIEDQVGTYVAQIVDLKESLRQNIKECIRELVRLKEYISSIDDSLIRQIILYRYESNLTWQQIAKKIGGNNSAESLRKRLYRHFNKFTIEN